MKIKVSYDLKRHSAGVRSMNAVRKLRKAAVISAVMFAVMSAVTVTAAAVERSFRLVPFLLTTLFFLMLSVSLLLLRHLNPVRSYEALRNNNSDFTYAIEFGENGITADIYGRHTLCGYSDISSAVEYDGYFVMHFRGGFFSFAQDDVPHERLEELRLLLRNRLGIRYMESFL